VVDAGHHVPRHDIAAGAWALAQYAFLYPRGTIHVAVVDPGVGSERHGLIAGCGGQVFVAPDNGLLTWVSRSAAGFEAHVIRPDVHRPEGCSHTFHGRDVFANVAGRLATGYEAIKDLATPAEELVIPQWGHVRSEGNTLVGEVIHIDHYGNVITSFHRSHLERSGWKEFHVRIGGGVISTIHQTYNEVQRGRPLALIGSHDHLEIAVYKGSAAEAMKLHRKDPVIIEPGA
jgi:S-adenosylmethionine hydrolase